MTHTMKDLLPMNDDALKQEIAEGLEKSSSWIKPSKENILKVAEFLDIDTCDIPKIERRKEETDQSLYERYILEMTMYTPCLICNGPRKPIMISEEKIAVFGGRKHTWPAQWSSPKCMRFRIHDATLNFAKNVKNANQILGPICEHGLFRSECKDCVTTHIS